MGSIRRASDSKLRREYDGTTALNFEQFVFVRRCDAEINLLRVAVALTCVTGEPVAPTVSKT